MRNIYEDPRTRLCLDAAGNRLNTGVPRQWRDCLPMPLIINQRWDSACDCGNKAVRLDMTGAELRPNIGRIMDSVVKTISFGIGRKNAERVESAVLDKAQDGWNLEATRPLFQKAEVCAGD